MDGFDWTSLGWTSLDWILVAVLALSALLGLWRGFIGVIASLAAWVLAGWAALRFGGDLALLLPSDGQPGPGQLLAGYVLAFIAVLLLVGVVGWVVRKMLHSVGLSGIDRFLGFVLGLLRGAIIACLLVLLMGLTPLPSYPDWQRSQLVPVFVPGAQWLRSLLPDWVAERVELLQETSKLVIPVPQPVQPQPVQPRVLPAPVPMPEPEPETEPEPPSAGPATIPQRTPLSA